MKYLPFLCVSFVFLFLTCSYERTIAPDDESMGVVNVSVKLGKIGSLGKIKCIEFDTLTLTLTAPGEDSFVSKIPISGKNQQVVTKTFSNLASLKTWTVSAIAKDKVGKTTHSGKTTFEVQPCGTTAVTLDLAAQYSMLKANFYPIRDSVNACMLWVDGEVVIDSSFSRTELRGDTVRLSYDYLSASPAGIQHTIRMDARGIVWGDDTLLYRGDTAVRAVSGENGSYTIKLKWVGPDIPPPGAATMTVVLGATGSVTVNGELEDKVLKEMKEIYQVNSVASIKINQWMKDLDPSQTRDSVIQYMSQQANVKKTLLSSDSMTIEIVYMNGLRALADIGRPGTLSSPGSYKGVSASATDERDNEINYLIDKLSSTTAITMSPKKDKDFSLYAITELRQYYLIHIATHGGVDSKGIPYILTGEKYVEPTNDWTYWEDYWVDKSITICPEIVSRNWVVFPAFIKKWTRSLPQSIVFLSSCQSMHNDAVLANAFLENSAAIVFGWEGYVTNEFAYKPLKDLLDTMIKNKCSAQEAFNLIPKDDLIDNGAIPDPAVFKMATRTEAKLPLVFKLIVSAAPLNSGTITVNPDKPVYSDGEPVDLNASFATGSGIVKWTGDVTEIGNSITITMDKDKNVIANFIHKYTVTFNSQGGSAVDPQIVDEGGLITKPTPPNRNGYTFGGWFNEPGCVKEWIFEKDAVIRDVTLYAEWTPTNYIITYHYSNNGMNGSNPTSYTIESPTIALTDAAKAAYIFDGWYSDAGFTSKVTSIATGSIGNREFWAKWIIKDADGNIYTEVTIGNQTWMVENLRTTKYRDGTDIPLVRDVDEWSNLATPGYCWYGNGGGPPYYKTPPYGALYNWYAVNTGNIAPAGWHTPTDAEWATFQDFLIKNNYNWDGTTTGNKIAKSLASTIPWNPSSIEGTIGNDLSKNNKSGFLAFPGGYRLIDGTFSGFSDIGNWWSLTENAEYYASGFILFYDHEDLFHGFRCNKKEGFSVRCIRNY